MKLKLKPKKKKLVLPSYEERLKECPPSENPHTLTWKCACGTVNTDFVKGLDYYPDGRGFGRFKDGFLFECAGCRRQIRVHATTVVPASGAHHYFNETTPFTKLKGGKKK